MTTPPTVKPDLEDLIRRGLTASYTSESCADGIETGNHYQSVSFGNDVSPGFRSERREYLDRIFFTGKRVLDLGSNLGELSRYARARGATLVDGFEFDPYFVELANLLNAYNGTTRVSFYERDITDPDTYREPYHIVLAFSVFIYIRDLLDAIASITNEILVLETHKLDGNLESTYLSVLRERFPAYRLLGETEWGTPHEDTDRRAVLVFATDERALELALETR